MNKLGEWITDHFYHIIVVIALILFLVVIFLPNPEEIESADLRANRGMILIEEGLVYNKETKVLYQEVPCYAHNRAYAWFYIPFYDANSEVILYNE